MNVPSNGSASAMATSHGTPRIVARRIDDRLITVVLVACLGVSGCGLGPPKDTKGNLPDDTVRKFIRLVQGKEYESAERLWYGASKRVAYTEGGTIDSRIKFEDFCTEFMHIDLATASISKAHRGKSGFWLVDIDWLEGGQKKHHQFGLKIVDGEWRMERGYDW